MEKDNLPIIIESETSNLFKRPVSGATGEHHAGEKKGSAAKILLIVLALVVAVEVVLGIRTLSKPSLTVGKIQPVSGGRMMLTSNQPTYKMDQPVVVSVRVDTAGHTVNGADVILRYDPKILSMSKSDIKTVGVFDEFPLIDVDPKVGVVRISGIVSPPQSGFNGIGTLARLNFTGQAAGNTYISLDFRPGSTTDSNLTDSNTSQDIMTDVQALNLNIIK